MITKLLIAIRRDRLPGSSDRAPHGHCPVAVYSDADANAVPCENADEAVHIGAAPARESYLVRGRNLNREGHRRGRHPSGLWLLVRARAFWPRPVSMRV